MIKKTIAIILIIVLLINSFLMLTSRLEPLWFWLFLAIIGIIVHYFFK